jgi:hypothetical protein
VEEVDMGRRGRFTQPCKDGLGFTFASFTSYTGSTSIQAQQQEDKTLSWLYHRAGIRAAFVD